MNHSTRGDSQDEVARLFEQRVRRGEFVHVGFDKLGQSLYMEAEAFRKPFAWLDAFASRTLHAFLRVFTRKGGAK